MSEDDKKLCYRAIELMNRYGCITVWTAESLSRCVEQSNDLPRVERLDAPPNKRTNA